MSSAAPFSTVWKMKPGMMLWTIQTASEWLIHWTFPLFHIQHFPLHDMCPSEFDCWQWQYKGCTVYLEAHISFWVFVVFSQISRNGGAEGALYPEVPPPTPHIHQEGHGKTYEHTDETTHLCIALLCTLLMCWPHALQVINGRCQSMPENSILANRKINKTPISYPWILYLEKWHKAVTMFKICIPNQPL